MKLIIQIPCLNEEATLPATIADLPRDIDGIYLRNTENQIHQPLGRYHPFDGDGMLHQISFENGRASYRNRWVRTRCFHAEQEAEGSLWGGLMDRSGTSLRPGFGAQAGVAGGKQHDWAGDGRPRILARRTAWPPRLARSRA